MLINIYFYSKKLLLLGRVNIINGLKFRDLYRFGPYIKNSIILVFKLMTACILFWSFCFFIIQWHVMCHMTS